MNVPYKSMMNSVAMNALTKPPIIPDARLMIESAEVQESIPILIFKNWNVSIFEKINWCFEKNGFFLFSHLL